MMSVNIKQYFTNLLNSGRGALTRGAWEEARVIFEEALNQEETPEAWEGLGLAAWWLDNIEVTFNALECAYRLYREQDDRQGAARIATYLASDYSTLRSEPAVARGWLRRAYRLLEGLNRSPEYGWLILCEGEIALLLDNDIAKARELGAQAAGLGRSLGMADLEMVGIAMEGLALVGEGKVTEGLHYLDEATVAAMVGELTDLNAAVMVCRYLIYACEWARDYNRAAQWCDKVKEFCQQWRIHSLFAFCRIHCATVFVWHGDWNEAETELVGAIHDLAATWPAMAVEGIVQLGELRRRQGRLVEAANLLERVEVRSKALLGRAALALDQGDPITATNLVNRFLRRLSPHNRTKRAVGLELLVQAQVALGEFTQAAHIVAELRAVTSTIATKPVQASASFAAGINAAAIGDYEMAQREFEDAIDLFEQSGAPFETGRARLELARSLSTLGRYDIAGQEVQIALETFQRIGAANEVERAETFLRKLETTIQEATGEIDFRPRLTPRECEVVCLIAQGLSNREIANQISLSEHTIHRHVANILTKLDLPSRAAVAAYAVRHNLL